MAVSVSSELQPSVYSMLIHAYRADFSEVGRAESIDFSGAVCEFLDEGPIYSGEVKIDILALNDPQRSLFAVPCTVSRVNLTGEGLPFGSVRMRRIEFRFESLNEEHREKLWVLLGRRALEEMSGQPAERAVKKRKRPSTHPFGASKR